MRLILIVFLFLSFHGAAAAEIDLTPDAADLSTRIDAFGLEEQLLTGEISNETAMAYANVTLYADLLDASGEIIGEGFGFLVDECGAAILDFPMQPDTTRRFALQVDLYEDDATVADWEIIAEGEAVEPETVPDSALYTGVTPLSNREVVLVEWLDENTLRYGMGCDDDVFTTYDWYRYDIEQASATRLPRHPNETHITDQMMGQTGITQITQSGAYDPRLFNTSFLTFPTTSERIVWQSDIHTLITGQRDGSFKRVVHTLLHQYQLQGFVWSPFGNFTAYYFGAYGEPVRYFTARAGGQLISQVLTANPPSQIVPGMLDDGTQVIAGATYDDITGYYLISTRTGGRELLYEAELPGNNYPAPAYWRKNSNTRFIYIVRQVRERTMLECVHRETKESYALTPLPLNLDTDERAWTWLSPDANWLAVGANGDHGGLWLVDLNAFDVCR